MVQGASGVEQWLLERVVEDALDDMEPYVRDAVEEQAEEEAWLDGVSPGRRDSRRRRETQEAKDDGGGAEEGANGSDDDGGPDGLVAEASAGAVAEIGGAAQEEV